MATKLYSVTVSQIGGADSTTIEVRATHPVEAQTRALYLVFDSHGWHRIAAAVPQEIGRGE